jgi:hypothetical protein
MCREAPEGPAQVAWERAGDKSRPPWCSAGGTTEFRAQGLLRQPRYSDLSSSSHERVQRRRFTLDRRGWCLQNGEGARQVARHSRYAATKCTSLRIPEDPAEANRSIGLLAALSIRSSPGRADGCERLAFPGQQILRYLQKYSSVVESLGRIG